jgi:hypothetical protein
MSGGFVVQSDWFPVAGTVVSWLEVENRPAVQGVSGIPLSSYGDLGLSVPIQVASSDAYVITFRQMIADPVFGPSWILIPSHLVLVDQYDVDFSVTIHVGKLKSVSDAYVDVDVLLPELGFICVDGKS